MVGSGEPVQIHGGENHLTPWWALLTSESEVSLDKPAGKNGSMEVISLCQFILPSPSLIVRVPQGSVLPSYYSAAHPHLLCCWAPSDSLVVKSVDSGARLGLNSGSRPSWETLIILGLSFLIGKMGLTVILPSGSEGC